MLKLTAIFLYSFRTDNPALKKRELIVIIFVEDAKKKRFKPSVVCQPETEDNFNFIKKKYNFFSVTINLDLITFGLTWNSTADKMDNSLLADKPTLVRRVSDLLKGNFLQLIINE